LASITAGSLTPSGDPVAAATKASVRALPASALQTAWQRGVQVTVRRYDDWVAGRPVHASWCEQLATEPRGRTRDAGVLPLDRRGLVDVSDGIEGDSSIPHQR
jgi:hypothetical protein